MNKTGNSTVYRKINTYPRAKKRLPDPLKVFAVALWLLLSGPFSALASSVESVIVKLSTPQQEQLHSFQPVLLQASTIGGTTEVVVVRRVNAPPPHVAKLFNDYAAAPRIFSSLSESKIVAHSGPSATIDYTLRLPLPIRVTYRMQHLATDHGSDGHSTKWQLLSSPVLKNAEGSIYFYPYKSGTLIHYRNKVTPTKLLQQLMKGQAPKEALKAVEELSRAAEAKQG